MDSWGLAFPRFTRVTVGVYPNMINLIWLPPKTDSHPLLLRMVSPSGWTSILDQHQPHPKKECKLNIPQNHWFVIAFPFELATLGLTSGKKSYDQKAQFFDGSVPCLVKTQAFCRLPRFNATSTTPPKIDKWVVSHSRIPGIWREVELRPCHHHPRGTM